MLDAFLPFVTFESKEWFGVAFRDWRQLEKIACNDQLWSVYVKLTLHIRGQSRCTCMPPNGRSVFFRRLWAIDESTSNKCPSTMETKPGLIQHRQVRSGIEALTLVDDQHFSRSPPIERRFTFPYAFDLFVEIGLTWRDCSPRMDSHTCQKQSQGIAPRGCGYRKGLRTWGSGGPKNVPPMFEAAIPVLAVTETTAGFFACFFLRDAIIARSSSDFPVPGQQTNTRLVTTNAK